MLQHQRLGHTGQCLRSCRILHDENICSRHHNRRCRRLTNTRSAVLRPGYKMHTHRVCSSQMKHSDCFPQERSLTLCEGMNICLWANDGMCGALSIVIRGWAVRTWPASRGVNTVTVGFGCVNTSSSFLHSQQMFFKNKTKHRLVFR